MTDVELAELGDDDDAFIRRTSDEDEEALIAEGPSSAATQRRTGRKICIAGTCIVVVLVLAVGTFLAYKFVLPKLHLGQSSSDLIQSPNDPRNYKALTLSNGLQVLLISSQAAVSGAAALDVHVGSWSDPPKIPGLAHFLEHMLFLGTKEFPEEDGYSKFLSQNGGYSNAYTASEDTNFFFEVNAPHLEEGLHRFSQFFISPLFNQNATDRELHAVHSEHMKNIQNDGWRLEQVAKETSNPSHPFHKFGTGNLKTLKEDPAKQQLDVRDQLLQFHNRHYFAQQMRLAVLGKDSIDTLEQWVRKYFSAIESKSEADLDSYNKSLLTPEAAGPVRLPHQRGVVIEIVPIKDLRSLSLSWFVKPMRQHYRLKPFQYIGGLLGHEGSGSVLSILRKKGWATSLSAGLEEESKYYSRFSVDVSLSEEGLVHVNEVSDLIFGYLSLLKTEKVQKWFWEENKKMSGLSWQFLEVSDNSGYVSSLASAMQYYDTKELLHHGFVYDKFDADLISSCVKMLSAEDVVQTIVSQKFDGNTSSKEQWYGTDYSMEKIDQARINQWEHAVVPKEMHVPKPNPFLPTDFTILAKGTRKIPLVLPTKFVDVVVEEPGLRVWHKLDDTFFTPRGIVFARVVMNEMKHDVKSRVSADLLIRLVNLALAEETYQGGLAGLGYGFSWSEDGLSFSFSGYTQHMGEWIERLMNKIPKYEVDRDKLVIVIDEVIRGYRSFNQSQPYSQAMYYGALMEYENRFTNEQYIKVLEDGSKDLSKFAMDLQLFFASLFRAASFTEILVHGNIAGNMAVEWARKIWTLAGSGQKHASVLPAAKRPTSRQRKWTRQHTYPVEGLNMQDPNSALVTIFGLGEYTITKSLTLALLSSVLNQPVYNQLRTIEQNGYLVFSGASVHIQEGVLGFYIAVQSPWNEPGNMSHSVDLLVQNTLQEAVDKLADADFEKERSAMIAGKLAPFEELSEETSFYWGEIGLRRYAFNHPRDDAALLKSLTKDDVKKLFSEYIGLPHASDRTQLSIWMYPPNRTDASIPPAGTKLPEAAGETISSPAEFCKKHPDFWKPLFPWKENIGLPVRPVVSKKPPPLR